MSVSAIIGMQLFVLFKSLVVEGFTHVVANGVLRVSSDFGVGWNRFFQSCLTWNLVSGCLICLSELRFMID